MKTKEKLSFYGLTDMGRQRTNNEDAFVAKQMDINTVLAVAIDGVGGYEGGEVAAEIAQTEIPKYLQDFPNGERLELLKQAVVSANNAIFDRRQVDTARPSMSCVLTSAIVDKQRKVIDMVHVGDTRLYQFHHGELRKLSHDHSLIGYREEMGDLTEEQAMHHPQRNVISRDVGSAKHEVADRDFLEAEEFPLLPNSIFLLCSDGLTDLITSKQIIEVLKTDKNIESKAKSLIDAANDAGGKDNVTVVLVEYNAEEKEKPVKQAVRELFVEEGDVAHRVDSDKKEEDKINLETKDMKKLNLVGTIVEVIVFLLCGVCLFYTYKVDQKLVELQSQFENHLLCSEIQSEAVTKDEEISLERDSLMGVISQQEREIKRIEEKLSDNGNGLVYERRIAELRKELDQKVQEIEKLKKELAVLKRSMN